MPQNWTWKPKQGKGNDLLYEPGNWGDLLKAAWMVRVAGWMANALGTNDFLYADPFAGAPTYPLGARTKVNLEAINDVVLDRYCAGFVKGGAWPSAAMLVAGACAKVPAANLRVFDAHAGRREALAACPRLSVLAGEFDGWELLRTQLVRQAGLVLLDPYDFLRDWREHLGAVLQQARAGTIMLYIYNRSAQGKERLRDYRDFRNALDDGLAGRAKYLARVPADPFLPGAHHEMLFMPGEVVAERTGFNGLVDELAQAAMRIASAIDERGVVEW